ncbi:MAG TPA: protease inhibitor I42 family protein [Polyangiaceae bacterium]|nr:protease inhibitor I42 family protein [Polyangiaceae bacterium]
MITVDATFNRRVVRATVGELLRLELPEDISAGQRWALAEPLPAQLRLLKDKTASLASATDRRLEFRVVAEGCCALSLINARAWQQPSTSFEVYVEAYEGEQDARSGTRASVRPLAPDQRGGNG